MNFLNQRGFLKPTTSQRIHTHAHTNKSKSTVKVFYSEKPAAHFKSRSYCLHLTPILTQTFRLYIETKLRLPDVVSNRLAQLQMFSAENRHQKI